MLVGTPERTWLRHYATSRKVAGSIPDEVIEIFNQPNPSSRGWQPHIICESAVYKMWGASTSQNPMGLQGLLQG
jgi:hypothetical protein